jgi:hypothetical protein
VSDDWIGLFDTSLRYYLGVDASQLTDNEWASAVVHLAEIRKREKRTEDNVNNVLM